MNRDPIIQALDVVDPDTIITVDFMEKELQLIADFLIKIGHPCEASDLETAAFHYLAICKEEEGYDGWLPLKEVDEWRHRLCGRLYEAKPIIANPDEH